MNQLPHSFLLLSHEGISRVTINLESVYNIDKLLAKFAITEKLLVIPRVSEHPCGILHAVTWSSDPPRRMSVLELTKGLMILATKYQTVTVDDQTWVSPCFQYQDKAFDLRCAFDFSLWAQAGLKLFLGLNPWTRSVQLWAYYDGQIYRPPLGNIFNGTCQLCLGRNDKAYTQIFTAGQLDNISQGFALKLLSDSLWNGDTFNGGDIPVINKLIRFDSTQSDLPMLPPLEPASIKTCSVAANKDLALITEKIINYA